MQRNRRDFLKLCGLAGLGVAVPLRNPGPTLAQERNNAYEGPYYIVFNASGGWDTTCLMDPKGVNNINRLYREGDILTRGNHRYAPTARHIQAGLSNEDFYQQFGNDLLVLNGLDYSVNNHSPGARYMATGKLDSMAYPTFAALVAPDVTASAMRTADSTVRTTRRRAPRLPACRPQVPRLEQAAISFRTKTGLLR